MSGRYASGEKKSVGAGENHVKEERRKRGCCRANCTLEAVAQVAPANMLSPQSARGAPACVWRGAVVKGRV